MTTMFMIDLGAQSHYSILGLAPDATPRDIRASVTKLVGDLERQIQKARSPEESRNLLDRKQDLSKIGLFLENPANRAAYDKNNAHLTFFQVRKAVTPVWDERDLLLRWLHQVVRDFLIAQGDTVQPVSDLERTDFTADFTPNELVERLLDEVHARERS